MPPDFRMTQHCTTDTDKMKMKVRGRVKVDGVGTRQTDWKNGSQEESEMEIAMPVAVL